MRCTALLMLLVWAPACSDAGTQATGPIESGGGSSMEPGPAGWSRAALRIPGDEVLRDRGNALLDRGLSAGKAWHYLKELCTLAPKRLSGSPGYEKAADWAFDAMIAAGLENVRRESVMVPRWVRGEIERCVAEASDGSKIDLAVTALGGTIGTGPVGITAEVIEVDGLEGLQKVKNEISGRVVFYNRPMRATARTTGAAYGEAVGQRVNGAREAVKYGAVAVLVRSMSTKLDDYPHTGAMRYGEEGSDKIPAAALGLISADRLSAALKQGTVRITLELEAETLPDVEQWNVIGEVPGSDLRDEIVLVGGHLDAWEVGSGAHDDGAGCAQSVEAARLLIEHGFRPRRTLRVVLFANEENGLAGANGYADRHGEGGAHFVAMESDSGGLGPRGIGLARPRDVVDRLQPLGFPLGAVGAERLFAGGGGADIGPLLPYGCFVSSLKVNDERYFDYHHSALDQLENVNPRELQLGAVVMAYWLAIFADCERDALASVADKSGDVPG
ncbi:MAG: M20/M25/M40 family metallo-hydrolase [Planctomycetes bacterium]|nr:M20/M25/M40 family metallo-hydrolase [Planctomycetota bacterium]